MAGALYGWAKAPCGLNLFFRLIQPAVDFPIPLIHARISAIQALVARILFRGLFGRLSFLLVVVLGLLLVLRSRRVKRDDSWNRCRETSQQSEPGIT